MTVADSLARFDRREALAHALAAHLADGPPIDPDPSYQPRHLRRNHDV